MTQTGTINVQNLNTTTRYVTDYQPGMTDQWCVLRTCEIHLYISGRAGKDPLRKETDVCYIPP